MQDKVSLSLAVMAILISAGSLAYTSSVVGGVSTQIDQTKKDLIGQVGSQASQVTSKISPLESSVNSVRQEQTAIRTLVEQRIGGLEKSLQEAQQRLSQAENVAQQSKKELETLKAEQALEEAAKKEHPPLIYGNVDSPHFVGTIWPRFRESYPWAPAEGKYIEGFTALRNRFISEFKAGAPSADILFYSAINIVGELSPYLTTYSSMKYVGIYPDEMAYPNKNEPIAFTTNLLPAVIIYNINLVNEKDAPKGWIELADPKWKNKLVTEDPKRLTTLTKIMADLQLQLGKDEWDKFMRGLAANSPTYVGSNSEAYAKVLAGEFPVSIGLLNDITNQKPGTPVKVAWPTKEPIGVPLGVSTMVGISQKAANPNFAKLFIQWLLSPTGQRAIGETGRSPALLTLDHPNSLAKVLPQGVKLMPNNVELWKDPKKWQDIVKSYFP